MNYASLMRKATIASTAVAAAGGLISLGIFARYRKATQEMRQAEELDTDHDDTGKKEEHFVFYTVDNENIPTLGKNN